MKLWHSSGHPACFSCLDSCHSRFWDRTSPMSTLGLDLQYYINASSLNMSPLGPYSPLPSVQTSFMIGPQSYPFPFFPPSTKRVIPISQNLSIQVPYRSPTTGHFTRSTFYKRQPIRGTFPDYLNLPEKFRGNSSLPHEIKRQHAIVLSYFS